MCMTTSVPFISVIIPTYNRVELLPRAVGSVLAQTHPHLELIVVDDGSEDATRGYLSGITDSRLRVIGQSRQGVAAARNTGIAASRGDYIAFLDSDDAWQKDKLEKQLAFSRSGGWEITQTEEIWMRNGRRVNPGRRHLKQGGWIFVPSLELCLVSPSCVLMSRRCWENIGPFDVSLLAGEDYDLWLRCALYYPIGLLPQALSIRYAGHLGQLSATIIGQDLYRIRSLCRLLEREKLDCEQRAMARQQLRLKAMRYVQGCLKRGKEGEAQRVVDMLAKINISLRPL